MKIDELRKKIDEVDEELLELLSTRLKLAEKIGQEKINSGKKVLDEQRESNVILKVKNRAKQFGLPIQPITQIFNEIMSLSKSTQYEQFPLIASVHSPIKIAFQGELGAYSHLALKKLFPNAQPIPSKTFSDAFNCIEQDFCDFAFIPVENSTEGSVGAVYDLLLQRNVVAIGELFQRIEHCLLSKKGSIAEIKTALSHPQALGQCRNFLESRGITAQEYYDTAGAAKLLSTQPENNCAAIASEEAAKQYGLNVVARGIEDNKNNYTRFLMLAKPEKSAELNKLIPRKEKTKTSVVLGLAHRPGTLSKILLKAARMNVNLTKIESRPTKTSPWEYVFYLDFEEETTQLKTREIINAITENSSFLKIIGSYPSGG